MGDYAIKTIRASEILDSRGNPTIEVEVSAGGVKAREQVPSGASTGIHEALELRDGGLRYNGKGVLKAVQNVNKLIAQKLAGHDVRNQEEIDRVMIELDGTDNKAKLGANAILGVSIACAKTAAAVLEMEVFEYLRTLEEIRPSRTVPLLFMNLINGGKHAKSPLAFQEYHVVPQVESIKDSLNMAMKIQSDLREVLVEKFGLTSANFGDESG